MGVIHGYRYLTNDTYSKGDRNSPIFFYAGNEGDIELFAENTGFMWEIAEEFEASLVFAEHRYYGKSLPFGNLSFTAPEYSGYLTSEQALADYAQLLVERVNLKQRPVIVFGGSYGGMLAAWFRIKYPHLVTGAIAASAPILQFITDCNRFNTIVSNVFTVGQGNCSQNIRETWNVIKLVKLSFSFSLSFVSNHCFLFFNKCLCSNFIYFAKQISSHFFF